MQESREVTLTGQIGDILDSLYSFYAETSAKSLYNTLFSALTEGKLAATGDTNKDIQSLETIREATTGILQAGATKLHDMTGIGLGASSDQIIRRTKIFIIQLYPLLANIIKEVLNGTINTEDKVLEEITKAREMLENKKSDISENKFQLLHSIITEYQNTAKLVITLKNNLYIAESIENRLDAIEQSLIQDMTDFDAIYPEKAYKACAQTFAKTIKIFLDESQIATRKKHKRTLLDLLALTEKTSVELGVTLSYIAASKADGKVEAERLNSPLSLLRQLINPSSLTSGESAQKQLFQAQSWFNKSTWQEAHDILTSFKLFIANALQHLDASKYLGEEEHSLIFFIDQFETAVKTRQEQYGTLHTLITNNLADAAEKDAKKHEALPKRLNNNTPSFWQKHKMKIILAVAACVLATALAVVTFGFGLIPLAFVAELAAAELIGIAVCSVVVSTVVGYTAGCFVDKKRAEGRLAPLEDVPRQSFVPETRGSVNDKDSGSKIQANKSWFLCCLGRKKPERRAAPRISGDSFRPGQ